MIERTLLVNLVARRSIRIDDGVRGSSIELAHCFLPPKPPSRSSPCSRSSLASSSSSSRPAPLCTKFLPPAPSSPLLLSANPYPAALPRPA